MPKFEDLTDKWDRRFLDLAAHVARWSRDPSTRVGAVIARPDHRIVSLGFNGFARGIEDREERYANRELKYKLVVHAEMNAIHFAKQDLTGCHLFTWPLPPCSRCAASIIQVGITRVIALPLMESLRERWAEDNEIAEMMFREAEVMLDLYPLKESAEGTD